MNQLTSGLGGRHRQMCLTSGGNSTQERGRLPSVTARRQIARTSRAAADASWHWQMGLTARREAFSHLCWLPALTWLHKSTTHEALRVAVWAGGQAEGLPEADLTMYMPPPYKGGLPPVLLPQSKVLAALEDLIATTQATDGTTVKYVPESMSDECMRRGAALTTGLPPMNRNLYEPVDLLRDE